MKNELYCCSELKIKITKCSCDSFWYNSKIGKSFSVSNITGRDYYTIENGSSKGILRVDAEIL